MYSSDKHFVHVYDNIMINIRDHMIIMIHHIINLHVQLGGELDGSSLAELVAVNIAIGHDCNRL